MFVPSPRLHNERARDDWLSPVDSQPSADKSWAPIRIPGSVSLGPGFPWRARQASRKSPFTGGDFVTARDADDDGRGDATPALVVRGGRGDPCQVRAQRRRCTCLCTVYIVTVSLGNGRFLGVKLSSRGVTDAPSPKGRRSSPPVVAAAATATTTTDLSRYAARGSFIFGLPKIDNRRSLFIA